MFHFLCPLLHMVETFSPASGHSGRSDIFCSFLPQQAFPWLHAGDTAEGSQPVLQELSPPGTQHTAISACSGCRRQRVLETPARENSCGGDAGVMEKTLEG